MIKRGDYVKFGCYPQNRGAVKDPIEWLTLEVNGYEALLISRFSLDSRPYHHEHTDITWEDCDLRKWLNHDFLKTAFSDEERQRIRLSETVNDHNPKYGVRGGNNTRDRVFCLSIAEAERYFKNGRERRCRPAALAKAQGAASGNEGYCWWWLRSPGCHERDASCVTPAQEFGMNASTAINIFARAVVRQRRIPFEIVSSESDVTREETMQAFLALREQAKKMELQT